MSHQLLHAHLRSRLLLGGCLGILLAGASACQSKTGSADESLHVRVGFGLSDRANREVAIRVLASGLYSEATIALDWNARLVGRIADEWTWQEDGRLLQFRIREGVTFHDGTVVTADTVTRALNAHREGRTQAATYSGGFRHVQEIVSSDERTVAIRLAVPDSFLLNELAESAIIGPTQSVGTGPFRMVSATSPHELERNEHYYGGRPAIERITITPYDSQRSAWAALMRGEIDVVQEVARDSVEFMEGSSQVAVHPVLRPFYIPLLFNLRHPVLKSPEVRRALNEAVNREEIIRDALRGYAQVADNPIWPAHWAYSSAARRYSHNPEAARLRLERAGFPVRPATREGMASRFQLQCLFWNEDPQFERIALLLQRQLAAVGVDLQLTGMGLEAIATGAAQGQFDTILMPFRSGRSLNVTYEYWRSPTSPAGGRLNSGYTGADAVFDHLRTVRSDAEIRTAVAELQQRFYEDAPAIFLAWQETARAVDARIDVSDGSAPDIFSNIWRWRPGTPRKAAR